MHAFLLFLSTDPYDRKITLKLNPSVGCIILVSSECCVSVVCCGPVGGEAGEKLWRQQQGAVASSPVPCVVVVVVTAITTAGPRAERRVESRERPRY